MFLLAATAVRARDWVDFTVAGCKVPATDEPLENFPVAVRISTERIPEFLYSDVAGTNDLLFSSLESEDPYPYEVETWNPTGESVVWVRLPSLCTNTQFRMSFNLPPDRPENPAPSNVWSAATYRGVWHMADDFDLSAGQNDSSGNGFNASYASGLTKSGVGPASAIGKAFYTSRDKNTVVQCATTPNLTSTMKMDWDGATLSGWAYYKGYAATSQAFLLRLNTSSSDYWGIVTQSKQVRSKFGTATGATIGPGLDPASGWFHWAIRVTGKTTYEYFLNGELLLTLQQGDRYSAQSATSQWSCGGTTGYLDEFRYRNAASSEAWIRAEYDSIKDADFVVASPVHRSGKTLTIIVE